METIINMLIPLIVIWFVVQRFIPARGIEHIGTDELKQILKNKDFQFVDVRTPAEFQMNHIKGFKNIPLSQIRRRQHELSKEKSVVVICQSGMRSNRATRILKKLGFQKVYNVKSGMASWRLD